MGTLPVRPGVVKEEHITYLNGLRGTGVNIYRMVRLLQDQFYLSEKDASDISLYWMRTYGRS